MTLHLPRALRWNNSTQLLVLPLIRHITLDLDTRSYTTLGSYSTANNIQQLRSFEHTPTSEPFTSARDINLQSV